MSDVFIPYKREEREKAHAIAEALAKRGHSVWWDVDLLPGDKFADEIEAVIRNARAAIVLWSESAISSDFVRAEASMAADRKILIPVRIDDCQPPLPFGTIHTLDLREWTGSPDDPLLDPLLLAIEKRLDSISLKQEGPEAVAEVLARPKGEVEFWKSVSERVPQSVKEYQLYLTEYGEDAAFSTLAKSRIEELESQTPESTNLTLKRYLGSSAAIATVLATITAAISLYVTLNGSALCEEPIFEMVSDESLCGFTEEEYEVTAASPRKCQDKSFGQVGWRYTEETAGSSGWMPGGFSQPDWCNRLTANFLSSRSIGSAHEKNVVSSSEQGRWTGPLGRTREYNYNCTVKVSWEPIYAEKVDESICGITPAVLDKRRVPKTCKIQVGTKKVSCDA